ncbi:hypothetical protein [Aeromicrobium sp. Leaf272]|uniref:hypothetical protein n=1 Tax=Aeromicrobium sp. Leaf272 TaxID=1736317 RepID=UPI0006F7A33B|nr:hypothetical protein [Aeromicrobium sp. Leaf272]KQP26178.1 hypothetical protein ASF38_11105 [Aeromicrobium sp. Leaf272]
MTLTGSDRAVLDATMRLAGGGSADAIQASAVATETGLDPTGIAASARRLESLGLISTLSSAQALLRLRLTQAGIDMGS